MDTCEYLARVGYAALLTDLGGPTVPEWADEDDPDAMAAAEHAADLTDYARVNSALIGTKSEPRAGELLGAKWLRLITWPDRVPDLKTWAGQSTLPKIITAHQRRLFDLDAATDPFAARGHYRTGRREGPSGLDALTCQDAVDVGFSPSKLGMEIECRPAVELLAVIGLETVPLVSFGARDCGFIHEGKLWRFDVEARDGGYYHRWGTLREHEALATA
jgi:hypothetical protein